jgi:DNA polymerase-3 subunit epsilon
MNRTIALDTETTGINKKRNGRGICDGHRVIEIGCVEIINGNITGNVFHEYIQPDMPIDPKAEAVHSINAEFLKSKPRFKEIASKFLQFIKDSTIIIHNAPFDIAFIDQELKQLPIKLQPQGTFKYIDTLTMARNLFPRHRNDLNALSERFNIKGRGDGSHGALVDAEILATLFLKMSHR